MYSVAGRQQHLEPLSCPCGEHAQPVFIGVTYGAWLLACVVAHSITTSNPIQHAGRLGKGVARTSSVLLSDSDNEAA